MRALTCTFLAAATALVLTSCKTAQTGRSAVKDVDATPQAGETPVQWWIPVIDDNSGKPVSDTYSKMSALCAVPKTDVDPPNWRLPTLAEVRYLARTSDSFSGTFTPGSAVWVTDAAASVGLGTGGHAAWTAGAPVAADETTPHFALCVGITSN